MTYEKKHYEMTVKDYTDSLTVSKRRDSDWCYLTMTVNDDKITNITIRSKAMAEALKFMLKEN